MNGIIIVDKPTGITSFDVVSRLRKLTGERKIGHSGTLDPLATGVLPLFLGSATRAVSLLPCQDKRYVAGLRLGVTTDTGDITGQVLSHTGFSVTAAEFAQAMEHFRGGITQLPPMYSAVRYQGRHLYDYARAGVEVPRQPRPVTVYDLAVRAGKETPGEYEIEVACSKGTYIRTLVTDIGQLLGCGAVMTSLRRIFASGFPISSAFTLEQLAQKKADGLLEDCRLDVEMAFRSLPAVEVTPRQAVRFGNGGGLSLQRLDTPPAQGNCRVRNGGRLIGIGSVHPDAQELRVAALFAPEQARDGRICVDHRNS